MIQDEDPKPEDRRLEGVRQFYASLVAAGGGELRERLESAFAFVPREHFLGPGPWFAGTFNNSRLRYIQTPNSDPILVYQDLLFALDQELGINNGEPVLHGQMLAALNPDRGDTVLHIGCGTGYYTAILAQLVGPTGKVIAYEINEKLAERATTCLAPWDIVSVVPATATAGVRLPHANAIYVNAGATHPDAAWLDALSDNGRLVFPLSASGTGMGVTLAITRRGKEFEARVVCRSAFIGCAGAYDEGEGLRVGKAVYSGSMMRVRRLVRDDSPDSSAVVTGDGWWLSSEPLAGR